MKICNLCNNEKNDDDFDKNRRQCKKCFYKKHKNIIQKIQKKYYQNNKEKIKDQSNEYRKQNEDKVKKRQNELRKTDKYKTYYKQYKQSIRWKQKEKNYSKEYYKNNKEQIKKYQKEKTKCKNCKLFQTHKKTNYLCSYCNTNSSKKQKTKELQLKTFLEKYYQLIHNKKVNLDNTCQRYFPDFLIDCNTFFVCIECDEYAHKTYDKLCELIRMNNIIFSLGLPIVFLRFNPDKKGIKMKTKQIILKSYIDFYLNKKLLNDNVIEYLFY